MTNFDMTTYQNEFLPVAGTSVHAIVTVESTDATIESAAATGSAVVLMLDISGSMEPRQKWKALQDAASVAIAQISDGVHFAVIAGTDIAEVVYPRRPGLVCASNETRTEAIGAVGALRAGGGTAIGRWLLEARERLVPHASWIRQAILVTDGRDESETPQELHAAIDSCRLVFQCDCRGVGTDWSVDELRSIASALLGSVDIVAEPADMTADFATMMRAAMDRRTADVRLRLWTPRGVTTSFVKQVSPTIEELSVTASAADGRTVDLATGAWGNETREYHVALAVPAHEVGDEMLAGRVSLIVDGAAVAQCLLKAVWTDDVATATRLNPRVAHFTGQTELAQAVVDGLSARERGDVHTATVRFGHAAQLAAAAGNHDTLALLDRVVDVVDATTGTVRLRRNVSAADTMTLDTRATRTVAVRGRS